MSKKTKRVCVVGLGQFGGELAIGFSGFAEVLAIDCNQSLVNKVADHVHRAYKLDARDYEGLASLVNDSFDIGIVCMGSNMEASILAVLHLKRIGVKTVYAKAKSEDHEKILQAIGADNVIFPERETARRVVRQILNPNLLDFVPLTDDFSVMQIAPPASFIGKTLIDLDIRGRFHVFVIAIKELIPERTLFIPSPDIVMRDDTILFVVGRVDDISSMIQGG